MDESIARMPSATQRIAPVGLLAGAWLRLPGGCGLQLRVVSGRVWVTRPGDPRDRFLGAGHRLRLDRPGIAMIEAVGGAVVEFAQQRDRAVRPALLPAAFPWLRRLRLAQTRLLRRWRRHARRRDRGSPRGGGHLL